MSDKQPEAILSCVCVCVVHTRLIAMDGRVLQMKKVRIIAVVVWSRMHIKKNINPARLVYNKSVFFSFSQINDQIFRLHLFVLLIPTITKQQQKPVWKHRPFVSRIIHYYIPKNHPL